MNLRPAGFDALLYVCNHVVANLPSGRLRIAFYRVCMQIDCGPRVCILAGLWLDCRGLLSIGENSVINQRCRLDARGGLVIGANVSISPEVHILTADHDMQAPDLAGRTRPVLIEDQVFIGSRAIILPGVTIGKGAAVGAGAVVTKSVEPYAMVAGVPAKNIGTRPKDIQVCMSYSRHFI
jgi:maltose O-acetyltransferase